MTPAERRASIRHYRSRRDFFADPHNRGKAPPIRPGMEDSRALCCRTLLLPELTPWDRQRLWSHIERRGEGECWPWRGALGDKGYGRFKVGGKLYLPHRFVHALDKGRIADAPEYHGSVVMHSCDNPSCCNPAHLTSGRQIENVADMIAKGRAHQFGRAVPPR